MEFTFILLAMMHLDTLLLLLLLLAAYAFTLCVRNTIDDKVVDVMPLVLCERTNHEISFINTCALIHSFNRSPN